MSQICFLNVNSPLKEDGPLSIQDSSPGPKNVHNSQFIGLILEYRPVLVTGQMQGSVRESSREVHTCCILYYPST